MAKEGERILKRIGAGDMVIALDRQGEMLTSPDLANAVKEWEMAGRKVVFVIGGSAGLSGDVLKRADRKVSFSKLTFPHQLFRLMLVEQIYRAFKIARGEPYHK
jgi:23S rRNA (pseudouridine1915-N3)-methyltransferase